MIVALLLGLVTSVFNVALHTLSLLSLRHVFEHRLRLNPNWHEIIHLGITMGAVTLTLLAAHVGEITVWALLFRAIALAPNGHIALYDAFMSYTSLGFALPPHSPWRLLEPMSTLNGILLAGLSTAVMFSALTRTTENYRAQNSH